MPVKVGTTISGTWDDGSGFPSQSHLVYAANSGVWWLFAITSASDTAGNPGTHVVKSFVSSGPDLATATWTAKTDSPNMDADSGTITGRLWHGRSLGVLYVNHTGTGFVNKDIVHISTSIYPDKAPDAGNGISFHIRAVLGPTSITWGTFGSYSAAAFNWGGGTDTDTLLLSGNAMGITSDGFVVVGAAVYHAELDCSVWSTFEPDTSDVWQSGGSGTGNTASGGSTVTAMSNQTNLKVGYGISAANVGVTTNGNAKVNSIDSGTQVTNSNTWGGASTGGTIRWNNMTCGSNRASSAVIDNTMVHKCTCYAFAPLAANQMLVVYDNGNQGPPLLDNLKSCKSNQTQAQGFWPSTTNGTGCINVFGSTSVQDSQDWCLVGVDVTRIFCAQRTAATTIRVNQYTDVGTGSWAAITNQPPALTGKTIKAGGGVMGITNGIDLWLCVIDGTDNAIKVTKYTVALGTWSAWSVLDTVDATATKLSGQPRVAPGVNQLGLVYSVTNGGSFDTFVSSLTVPGPLVPYPVANRPAPFKPGSATLRGY